MCYTDKCLPKGTEEKKKREGRVVGEKVRGYGSHRDYITNTFNVQSRICWGKPFWKTVGELLRSERQLGRGQKLGENK